ncbi:hypothetical protein Tco_0084281 [Tanacetum coccineum]
MDKFSQNKQWDNIRGSSTENSDGLAAYKMHNLNNLEERLRINEKVYAVSGHEQCKGPHYTKDCPLKEEGKTLEEAYYTRNQVDDLMPTIEEGEVIEKFRVRNEVLDTGIDDYPSYCDEDKKIHIDCAHNLKFLCMIRFEFTHANFFPLLYVNIMSRKFHNSIMKNKMVYKGNNVVGALMNVPIFVGTFSVMTDFAVLEDMDAYRDDEMGDVIFGEPFLREVGTKTKQFEGIITLYNGDDEVTYQMVRSHPSKRHAFWSLNEDILKITILKTNTPYPSRRYGVSVPALTKDHRIKDQYAVSRKVYAVGNAGTNSDVNIVTSTFLLNNCYDSVLFNIGTDRSFVYNAFSSQIDIAPTVLDHDYAIELADGRIIGVNTIIRSCTLNFLNHPFNINLMPVEMVHTWGRETLIFHGNGSNREHETRLNIISCTKTQKYMLKGCQVFLAHVTTKEAEDKSKKKRLDNVPIVQDFPKVFPKDLPGLPLTRQVEFPN